MHEIEQYQHLLHAKTSGYRRKLDRAWSLIDEGLSVMQQGYLAWSSGIDSSVLLDLLYARGLRLPVLYGDDGFDYPQSIAHLAWGEQHYGFRLTRIRSMNPWRDWCVEMGRPELARDPAAYAAWGNPRQWDDTWHSLTRDAPTHGYDGVFLGMLASESRSRAYQLHDGHKPLYRVKSEQDIWHCNPLASWNKSDIWAYVAANDLPSNPVYDRLADLGVPLARRRVAALTCFRVQQFGSVAVLRSGWPDLYNRLAATFPRVREYA